MERHELERAARANDALKRAEADLAAITGHRITAITIANNLHPIILEKGRGGTGTISSIGFPDDLADALTAALYVYFRSKAETARAELASFGVNIAA